MGNLVQFSIRQFELDMPLFEEFLNLFSLGDVVEIDDDATNRRMLHAIVAKHFHQAPVPVCAPDAHFHHVRRTGAVGAVGQKMLQGRRIARMNEFSEVAADQLGRPVAQDAPDRIADELDRRRQRREYRDDIRSVVDQRTKTLFAGAQSVLLCQKHLLDPFDLLEARKEKPDGDRRDNQY